MARRSKRDDGRYGVTVRLEQPDGNRRRAYFYGRTQAEARAKAEAVLALVEAGGLVRDANLPLGAWLLERAKRSCAPATGAVDQADVRRPCTPRRPDHRHVTLARLRPSDITRVLLAMEQAGKSASTRVTAAPSCASPPKDAVANGLLATNPAAGSGSIGTRSMSQHIR